MKVLDIDTWNRKQHYHHFRGLMDPYFAVTMPFNVSKAYQFSKDNHLSFFAKYLHDCMNLMQHCVSKSATKMQTQNMFSFQYTSYYYLHKCVTFCDTVFQIMIFIYFNVTQFMKYPV